MKIKTKYNIDEKVKFLSYEKDLILHVGTIYKITLTIYKNKIHSTYHIQTEDGMYLSRHEHKVFKYK
jgi:hypothetical protein